MYMEFVVNIHTDIDHCAVIECLNNGTCEDGVVDFTCNCIAGYDGRLCESGKDLSPI